MNTSLNMSHNSSVVNTSMNVTVDENNSYSHPSSMNSLPSLMHVMNNSTNSNNTTNETNKINHLVLPYHNQQAQNISNFPYFYHPYTNSNLNQNQMWSSQYYNTQNMNQRSNSSQYHEQDSSTTPKLNNENKMSTSFNQNKV